MAVELGQGTALCIPGRQKEALHFMGKEGELGSLCSLFMAHQAFRKNIYTRKRVRVGDPWSLKPCAYRNSLLLPGSWPHSLYGMLSQESTADLVCPCGLVREACQKQTCQVTEDRANK